MDDLGDLSDGRSGHITYLSASPFEMYHILNQLDSAPKHPVFGHLLVPDQSAEQPQASLPCVVAVHGSGGWSAHHHDHIENWLAAGLAVFRVHSFDARQIDSIVETQMEVTHAMMLADAYAALELLATHPKIDAERIGISGWSLGGTVALYAAWSPIPEALARPQTRFAAHLPFYPAAHMRPEEQRWEQAPILVLHGEADDYTPLPLVTGLARIAAEHGKTIEVVQYENAHHSFDSREPISWNPAAIRLDERTLRIDMQGNMSAELAAGMRIPLNEPHERLAAFQHQQENILGAHYGGNEAARKASQTASTNFLKTSLSADP